MSNDLAIQKLLPSLSNTSLVREKFRNSTFIGIDFGTSTTVVSYAVIGDAGSPIKTSYMPIRQLNPDGSFSESHLVPSCIAFHDNKLFIGQTAKQLKSKLSFGKNLWYSFKMSIGTDNGPVYYSTELAKGNPVATIENPLDAAKVFFKYLKHEIDQFIAKNNLPSQTYYSISIPASFEANQRRDLKEALEEAKIPFQDSLFIDEPNSAFLSYLIEANNNDHQGYNIPLDSPLHILVFDFGAGTCDISILEVGRKSGRLYSKNIAISKFEQLGGDDIDKKIVKEVLLPQLLTENNIDIDEIRTPEYIKIILPKLQPIAEHLKIQACKTVARNLVGRQLPPLANSDERIKVNQNFQILLPKHRLDYTSPSMSFKEFGSIMDKFTSMDSLFDFEDDSESLKSIFSTVNSALRKGNLNKDDIDLVLLIGGSSYNPYVQTSLRNYFTQSELEIPKDLQAHVSNGASVNSFLQNGLNIDMIKPIVSEPVYIILENNNLRTVIREGTEIPSKNITVDDLHPQKDGQKVLEIPICVSSSNKILSNVKITSEQGFVRTDTIRLVCDISHDKLIYFKAFVRDIEVDVEPLNPFANTSLTTEEIAEKRLLKALNEASKKNGGKPPVYLLNELANFYAKLDKHLKAAETFELIQQLNPNANNEASICYHYSWAGKRKQSIKWAQIAYERNPTGTNAYNLALFKKEEGKMEEHLQLMEEAVSKYCDAAFLTFGEHLIRKDKDRAMTLIKNCFDNWHSEFHSNVLHKSNYKRLIRAAELLGKTEVAEEVKRAEEDLLRASKINWYNTDNLLSNNKNDLLELNL
jgi:molecular chaperone DnaK